MKKQIVEVVTVLFLIVGTASLASAAVSGGKHDFTPLSGLTFIGDNDEVCVYCHTPHAAVVTDRVGGTPRLPLWNRSLNEGAVNFTMYNSSTLNAVVPGDGKPTGYSLMCLSCHDGVTSIGAVINNSGPNPSINMGPGPDTIGAIPYPPGKDINIGRDLSNDHPVSFDYAAVVSADPDIQVPSNAALKLPGGRMECTTCHDPHDDGSLSGKAPFLRMSNVGSAMCLSCHIK